ncbi:DUF1796 family putative cysteine peptidase [Peribacillus frigoritolerans]|uniref:DUF1796 family putative cysteine peptidase n=1 Tax=Peribacillus frigoritolerans TaxID=450367 RepID=UPI0028933561|nr:DUF1796 family putative cysteine peptidase [Peribacillus frigoritolerans]MEE3951771.1 DUF1796 family putative cysteine peptidase [Peribacillus frigoritolerans]
MTELKLQDIKGSYDVIISLGSWCGPSLNLRRHNLRRFSFPLDWVVSNSLPDVSRILKNRFVGFMDLKNMKQVDGIASYLDDGDVVFSDEGGKQQKAHFIQDTYYNVISVHDFPMIPNQDWTHLYPAYKEKLNYRINKFIEIISNSNSILFVRWGAVSVREADELQSVLSEMIQGKFNILFLDPIAGLENVNEIDWGIKGICTVQVPSDGPNDDSMWDYVYNGLTLTKTYS